MDTVAHGTFELEPQGPFSLAEAGRFIGAWHETPAEGSAPPGHLHLVFLTDRGFEPVGVCLQQDAGGAVRGEVYGTPEIEPARAKVARILSLDVDGREWPEVGKRDAVVGLLQRRFPGFRPVNWSDAYEAAAWCLISTRVNMRQAQSTKDRMNRELGHEVDVHGHRMWTFPDPAGLLELRTFKGLFGRKVEYLNGLATAALAGRLDTDRLRALGGAECLAQLQKLPGIGEFGSQLVRLRALSAVDELPTREPRLLSAVREAYDLNADPGLAELEQIADGWRPYRMWVAVCLRRTSGSGASMVHSRASG